MMVGTQSKPVPIDFLKINREVTIQTSFRYCNIPADDRSDLIRKI